MYPFLTFESAYFYINMNKTAELIYFYTRLLLKLSNFCD